MTSQKLARGFGCDRMGPNDTNWLIASHGEFRILNSKTYVGIPLSVLTEGKHFFSDLKATKSWLTQIAATKVRLKLIPILILKAVDPL